MFMGSIAQLGRRWRQRTQPVAVRVPEPAIQGAIDELSADHVAGWMMDPANPSHRLPYEVICTQSGRVLGAGIADQYRHHLSWQGIGDAANGFHARLSGQPVLPGGIEVRMVGGRTALALSPQLRTSFEPILHVAMDIVDNCNLRCPFCLYDYTNTRTTHFMTPETLQSALRLLPYVRDGQFWFSCLHEPTLHPQLMAFIDTVPAEYRKKLFYTTNLAKRMPDAYFDWLANSGLFNINVSVESRDPAIYERMRKGARHRIFADNWEKLLAAFARAPAPPRLRYIAMAYKSNVDELPELARYLLEERQAWQFEIRYTFDAPYIPAEFRDAEFLDAADWVRLRERLPAYPSDRLLLISPPEPAPAPGPDTPAAPAVSPRFQPDYYMFRLSWDGTLQVAGISPDSRYGNAIERDMLSTNLDVVPDMRGFIDGLGRKQGLLF